ncbi:hypothetical protein [uncultured Thermanaerothrix sp.]|uniref:zinc ribbon domain-containing protein n=1 Tax=uncultured Thermanaerothrix sp. TaxID=1195149 RepID=UPI0026371954|nr:hypothetical protein [uncultured Thermanaerothrix sp.]
MSTVVCPQCGSSNPSENEYCQWCHAPLHPEATSGVESPANSEIDLPDWLKEAGPLIPPLAESPEEELPDWLLSLRQESKTADLREEIQAISSEEPFLAPDPEEKLPTAGDEEAAQADLFTPPEPPEQGDLSGWTRGFEGEEITEETSHATENTSSSSLSEEELPEWLKTLREQEGSLAQKPFSARDESIPTSFAPKSEPFTEEILPEWPDDLRTPSEEEKEAEPPVSEAIAQEVKADKASTPSPETISPFTEIPEDITAWFEETPSSLLGDQSSSALKSPSSSEEIAQFADLITTSETPEEVPEAIPAFSEDDYAAWLDRLQVEETLEGEDLSNQVPVFIEEGVTETAPSPETIVPPFIESELPEWLAEEGSPAEETEGSAIPTTQLPEWLEAMRPVEAVAPAPPQTPEEDTRIETSGPLAGFPGVLPGEPEALRYSRPPIHAVRLSVSEKQRAYVALLESLVTAESTPVPIRSQKLVTAPSPILRFIITVLLFAILIAGLMSATPLSDLPALFPAEVVAFTTTLNNLSTQQANPRVLVGLDIDAGFLPEIRISAVNALSDLMRQNARLVFLPLQSSAPILGLSIAQEAAQQVPNYALADQSVHLGYLAGETAGLAAFAYQPRLGIATTLEGQSAWDTQPLIGVDSLQDFDAILLITDSGERARGWIEQMRPSFPERPFLIISSAQAAPYLIPYVQSGQVNGVLTGLLGSILYIRLTPKVGSENLALWSAYQWGSLTITLLILLGALLGATQALLQAQKAHPKR